MHEFSLMNGIVNKINQIALIQKAEQVTLVKVRLGALAHISSEHFKEHFEHAVKGGVAEGARIEIYQETDRTDPNAQEIILESIEIKESKATEEHM